MKIHYLQHVPFEDLANIESWARSRGHDLSRTLLFSGEELPEMNQFDWLIIMGGPMNIYEDDRYPWLLKEKKFIRQAIDCEKIVLGICLGAQLMADALGSSVRRNEYKEIGWFAVSLTDEGILSPIFSALPGRFVALHWHGDTFGIPPGAMRIAGSRACANQAFIKEKAIALQFHLESSRDSIDHLLENCADELTDGPYIQSPKELAAHPELLCQIQSLMELLLDRVESVLGSEKGTS